ncbi:sensor histidine kinase [Leifsonia shinshuensis]|uniref:sensor histidine kinase n=1 Tax=Leifsonia shinshuensis TaxID=150026 RepID=UPI001F50B44A|nr:sensor histidine kinase [Leifsonia shinshuensis]MCI0156287.1 sensor histidine kinase [Leifsonia shinshuensis]
MSERTSSADSLRDRRVLLVDGAIALVLAVITVAGVGVELAGSPFVFPSPVGAYMLAVAACAPLVVRRSYPISASIAVLLVTACYHLVGYPGQAPALALFPALYAVAAYGTRIRSLVTAVALAAAWSVIPTLPPHPLPWTSWPILGPAIGMVWLAVVGATVRQSRLTARLGYENAAALAEATLREDLARERLGMAHELHDVLAHTISVISVQSSVALDSIDTDPAAARQAMATVRSLARRAIPEVRATLELLRNPGDADARNVPQPGLAQLPELAEQARDAGLTVELSVDVDDATIGPHLELIAYRIAQEAVTNVIRHSDATTVRISIRRAGTDLLVEIVDDGHGTDRPLKAGLGLTGMSERAAAVGGTVDAGFVAGGGFRVRAGLPGAPGDSADTAARRSPSDTRSLP